MRVYMDNCRNNEHQRWQNLREDNKIVDVKVFDGNRHHVSPYPSWVLIDHD